METNRKFDLEERLTDFAVMIVLICENMKETYASRHLASQLVRSGTSPALNYGEAMSSESRRDFIHKLKVALKELRESNMSLKIIQKTTLCNSEAAILTALNECNELISIFVKSVETARKNMKNDSR